MEVYSGLVSEEDINQKFLRSLPPAWSQIALIMRNKADIDEVDIDDLYNNLRVYDDEMKRSSSSSTTSQNLAFLSSENTSSTNKVSTASREFGVNTAGGTSQVSSAPCVYEAACSFFAQPTSPQLVNEDFQQIDGHFGRECRSGRNQGRRSNGDNGRSNTPTNESSSQALVAQDGLGGYDWSNDFEIESVNYALNSGSDGTAAIKSYDSRFKEIKKQHVGYEFVNAAKISDRLSVTNSHGRKETWNLRLFSNSLVTGTQDSYVQVSSEKIKERFSGIHDCCSLLTPSWTMIPVEDDSEDVANKEGQHQMTEDEQVLHDDLEKMIAQEVAASTGAHRNWNATINVSPIPTLRIHKDHLKDQILGDPKSAVQTRGKIQKDSSAQQALVSYISKQNRTNHKDHQNYLLACFLSQEEPKNISQPLQDESWVEAMPEEIACSSNYKRMNTCLNFDLGKRQLALNGSSRIKRMREVKQQLDGIFISQHKYVADMLKKFNFWSIRTANTPIESNKPLVKDEDGVDVDVYVYRSMIGSLMYLIASRPDIMFAICACARFQVTHKASHLNAVKRIFRYLKHQPKLGLWYPKDSHFELEAYSDSDYRGASLDRKSTTGGCQFLSRRLISWQCKKQTIVANSTTEVEYVAAANCCGQVLWIQNQMMDYGFNFLNTRIHIDNESTISVIKNPVDHSRTKHIEIRFHFIRDCYEKRLIEVVKIHTDNNVADLLTKGFDITRFNFLIVSIRMMNS
ncbi:hypothetical protein Tco_0066156 [Tanacetum coccineum]